MHLNASLFSSAKKHGLLHNSVYLPVDGRRISLEAEEKVVICCHGEKINCPRHSRILSLKVPESVKLHSVCFVSL